MNARAVAVTALVAALLTGCATTASQEAEPSGSLAFNLAMGVTQIAFESAFERHRRHTNKDKGARR